MEIATFGAGCFWGIEDAFRHVEGVVSTRVGYTGGTVQHPTYAQVCAGTTGHTEAVEVTFDPSVISYDRLLEVFWSIHHPTYPQKTQYASRIFYHTPEQRAAAEASRDRHRQAGSGARPIVTEILPAGDFWAAEEYHQQYYEKQGGGSCACG